MTVDTAAISDLRKQLEAAKLHERRTAARALLIRPFLPASDESLALVRRHASWLRDWFAREAGWTLHVDRSHARLRKMPARLDDTSRGAHARPADPPFSRRRYVLLCLALAALEAEERQTALGRLADRILGSIAADPELAAAGVRFTLEGRDERRDLVAVARLLMRLGVLRRVDGDELAYVAGAGDALYAVDRTALAAVLATRQPPGTVEAVDLDERLAAVTHEPVPDTTDGRNRAIRHRLTRWLLDEPVLAYDELDEAERSYLHSQRPRLLSTIEEVTGLVPEVRAEGIAMLDERGDLTDLRMPEVGTDGHLTLLLAEYLAEALERRSGQAVPREEIDAHAVALARQHAPHWRKEASDPEAVPGMAGDAIERLAALGLVTVTDEGVAPRPPIARYAVAEPKLPANSDLLEGTRAGAGRTDAQSNPANPDLLEGDAS